MSKNFYALCVCVCVCVCVRARARARANYGLLLFICVFSVGLFVCLFVFDSLLHISFLSGVAYC